MRRKEKAVRNDAKEVFARLFSAIPDPHIELDYADPWQLLIATILSAQSTDKRVNEVTPQLFARHPDPRSLGEAKQEEVEALVKSTGFFRNKAKAIRAASKMITERFGQEVPKTIEELVELPGVARKTANLVLAGGYGIASGIVIDTHARRVAQRLGLTKEEDPEKIEADLMGQIDRQDWIAVGLALILHGRYLCTARAPSCATCPLNEPCKSRESRPEGTWKQRADKERELIPKKR
jgi:endonuclease-3